MNLLRNACPYFDLNWDVCSCVFDTISYHNPDKFMDDMLKQHGSTFRFIDIKFSSTPKLIQDARNNIDIIYSALLLYEI